MIRLLILNRCIFQNDIILTTTLINFDFNLLVRCFQFLDFNNFFQERKGDPSTVGSKEWSVKSHQMIMKILKVKSLQSKVVEKIL